MGKSEHTQVEENECDHNQARLNRFVIISGLFLVTASFFSIVRMFIVPVILAATFVTLLYPSYRWVLKHLRNRRGLASLVCCIAFLLILLIPLTIMSNLLALQAIDLYNTAEPKVRQIAENSDEKLLGSITDSRLGRLLNINKVDWEAGMGEVVKAAGSAITTVINNTARSVFALLTSVLITLFTMFYFFRDGPDIVKHITYLSPLNREYEKELLDRFVLISRATVKGTLLIGLMQGTLGAITFLICGIDTWILWGAVMVILSIIPLVGSWVIMIPAAIIEVFLGNIWQGIVIFLVCTLVISNIDNLIRPRLVGRSAKMHDLLIFFSTLGGIAVFGVMGFIIGPVIAALFITFLDIYAAEYRNELSATRTAVDDCKE